MDKADQFLNNFLGEGFLESLKKSNELFKLGTQTALNPDEIKIGLKIVPRAIMSFLISQLVPMEVGSHKSIPLPCGVNAILNVNKGDSDSYSGSVVSDNKPVYDYRNRSIPGIGIILLSTFELYDMDELEKEHKCSPGLEQNVQKLIDERLEQRALIEKVIDQKLTEREAVHKLVMQKLTEAMHRPVTVVPPTPVAPSIPAPKMDIDVEPSDIVKKEAPVKKGSPLKEFVARKKPKEHFVQIMKSESRNCDSCGQVVFNDLNFSSCVCLGENMDSKIWIKKSQDGVLVKFSKNWNIENMEMLLEVLRKK